MLYLGNYLSCQGEWAKVSVNVETKGFNDNAQKLKVSVTSHINTCLTVISTKSTHRTATASIVFTLLPVRLNW